MYHALTTWSVSEQTIEFGGHQYPDAILLADEDGVPFYVTATDEIPTLVWTDAEARGAAIIVYVDGDDAFAISTQTFLEHRVQIPANRTFGLPDPTQVTWVPVSDGLTYRRFIDWKEESEQPAPPPEPENFVHLHAHSEHSALDGLSSVKEMANRAAALGQPAIAVTDHGVCAGHPQLQIVADKAGIKPIFGIEAYLVDDRHFRPRGKTPPAGTIDKNNKEALEEWIRVSDEEKARARSYYHLILWAQNDVGLRNIWAMTTEANRSGFYVRPRMDWDTLAQHSEGVLCSTACLHGPLAYPLKEYQDEALALSNLGRLQGIYGDRLWLELHTTTVPEQRPINEWLVSTAQDRGLPLIAVSDSHYCLAEDQHAHDVWMSIQTNKELQDENDMFVGHHDYHIMSRDEAAKALSYLPSSAVTEALDNTVAVADLCTARVEGQSDPPVFSKKGDTREERIDDDYERLIDLCISNWSKTDGKYRRDADGNKVLIEQEEYEERFRKEMALIKAKGFCGYFLMVADYCQYALDNDILVGPGRGSGGGCLIAYLSGITAIDPVEAGLLFERFLTWGRTELPDFDVDFPASKRPEMTEYIVGRYGEDHTVRVGTQIKLKNKGIFRDLERVLKSTTEINPDDITAITKLIEQAEADSAGLGYGWEEILASYEKEFEPYSTKYPELFDLAGKLTNRIKTYGKHPAGLVISEVPITDRLPMWVGKDGIPVTEFDMDVLTELGLVKFDILTIRTLDTIQVALDLIAQSTGQRINPYFWREEYEDQEVWKQFGEGHTLGMFQVETYAGTRMCRRFKPTSLDELSDVITLVRPGPTKSGLTETYLQRRDGYEPVAYPHDDLSTVLHKTYGCMLYQEDIMNICQVIGGYSLEEADKIRKILGKKKVAEAEGAGVEFVERSVERGYDRTLIQSLWDEMFEFSKYSFNRSHAYAYGVIGYWTAWLKHHYPVEFLTACLSTVKKDRIPEFVQECRRLDIRILPPDINLSGQGFRSYPKASEILYGLDGIMGVGESNVISIEEGQPYSSFEDFRERSGTNSGVAGTLATIGAFDRLHPNRLGLMALHEWSVSDKSTLCQHHGAPITVGNDKGETWKIPCAYNWGEEPVEIGASGRPKKRKPPPKRCTRGCRQYLAPGPPDIDINDADEAIPDYEVMRIEREHLGYHLSVTPFDRVPLDLFEETLSFEQIDTAPPGRYMVLGIIEGIRMKNDRNDREMAFLTVGTQTGPLRVVVFSSVWEKAQEEVWDQRLVVLLVRKQDGPRTGYLLESHTTTQPSIVGM